MSKFLFNFWINIEPFRNKWILPLIFLTLIILVFYFFGHTDEMRCNWEVRDRWECYPNITNES
ncbi:MAG: hypothetical protein CL769_00615 [Chloroflexi bacterium]|nr:hypothetical protein [Chloroflexota bacterium]